jgi:hypothetical protein
MSTQRRCWFRWNPPALINASWAVKEKVVKPQFLEKPGVAGKVSRLSLQAAKKQVAIVNDWFFGFSILSYMMSSSLVED